MEFQDRQFLPLGKRPIAFVAIAILASLMLAAAGPAQAKRMLGTNGADRIVGTAKADVIKSLGGHDRLKGRGGRDRLSGGSGRDRLAGGPGRDRLSGGRGADRLNAFDGRPDRVVKGGPGKDVCKVDAADQAKVKGCEIVKLVTPGAPGAPGGPGGARVCASPPEAARLGTGSLGRAAQDEPPPTFSAPFYAITLAISASADGLTGAELPISIEEVCDVPQALATEAAQLVGGDGVALISPATTVFDSAGQQVTGTAATTALAGADTVALKARLQPPSGWRQDEDGQPVPTFSVSRADITD